jgi:hypothetical protein
MALKLKMEVEIPENLLDNIMVTAFDGDYGGCWHWAEPYLTDSEDDYIKIAPLDMSDSPAWIEARIRGKEQGVHDLMPNFWVVSWETIRAGMQKIIDGDFSGHEALRRLQGYIQEAVIEDDGSLLDANAVDTIIQYGLFDNEIYS